MTDCPTCGSPDPKLHPVPDIGPHGRTPESLIGSKVDHVKTCPDQYHSPGADQLTDAQIAELARRLTKVLEDADVGRGTSSWEIARARLGRELHDALAAALGDPTADDARDYRTLANQVIKWFNPPDDDVAEIAIHLDAVMRAGKFIEEQPCTCEEGAAEFLVDPCPRCQALGRAADRPEER